jgi:hypothetical protein
LSHRVAGLTRPVSKPRHPVTDVAHTDRTKEVTVRDRNARVMAMQPVPIDEGAQDRRRIGPFWIEEGLGLVYAGAAMLAVVVALYILAVILRPS